MKTISVKELSELLAGENGPRVIDVRDGDAYAGGHIPGAQHIPVKRLQTSPGFVPDDREVFTYDDSSGEQSDGGGSAASYEAARILADHGIEAGVLVGGMAAWVEAGYPVEFV